jgi:hypothetical protein
LVLFLQGMGILACGFDWLAGRNDLELFRCLNATLFPEFP